MNKNKGSDYSKVLIWSAALVTVVRYVAAFIASDMGQIPDGWLSELITALMGFSGLGMGILDVIGGTYLFDGWRRAMPATGQAWKPRFKVLTIFIFALMGTGVMILVPFTESRVTHSSMASVLGDGAGLTWWSFLVNVAPYLLIGGVAVGNQVVTVNQTSSPTQGERTGERSPNDSGRKYSTLSNSEKYLILNTNSQNAAAELGVTQRAIQKWRKKVQEEVSKGLL